jgi:hypothetical protein
MLPALVGVVVLLAAGVVHGLWNDRWQPSEALAEASARLDQLPTKFGAWTSEQVEQDAESLAQAGAVNHYSRLFLDPVTGEHVTLLILCGKPARMAVHRPEHCYKSAGYELHDQPSRCQVKVGELPAAELWTALFVRNEATTASSGHQLRIFWTWVVEGRCTAPKSPRLELARQRSIYKMYIIRSLSGPERPLNSDPCVRLLGEVLPVLDRTLTTAVAIPQ